MFGGKLTTYRKLAEHAMELMAPHLPPLSGQAGWTGRAALPGGDFPVDGFDALVAGLRARWPFLTALHARRLARHYGTAAEVILGGAKTLADLGRDFGATLTEAEVAHLMDREWARTAADIAWRRHQTRPAALGGRTRRARPLHGGPGAQTASSRVAAAQ